MRNNLYRSVFVIKLARTYVVALLLLSFLGCQEKTKPVTESNEQSDIGTVNGYINLYSNTKQYYLLDVDRSSKGSRADTMFISCENRQCSIYWHTDTLLTESSYLNSTGFVSPLHALGCKNTFIIKSYEGDGCPAAYRLLEFKNDSSYFLSEKFRNCEEICSLKFTWPSMELEFSEMPEAERKKTTYVYNRKKFTLTQSALWAQHDNCHRFQFSLAAQEWTNTNWISHWLISRKICSSILFKKNRRFTFYRNKKSYIRLM